MDLGPGTQIQEDIMGLRINQNIAAMNAYRNLSKTDMQLSKSLEKLSSGFRINRAADDAAGLSISEGLRSEVSGFKMAVRNAQDGVSLIQTAEGALGEVTSLLQRVRELAVQAANSGANDQAARDAIGSEVTQDLNEIDRIGASTVYGSKNLLAAAGTFTFQIGYSGAASNQLGVAVSAVSSGALGVTIAATVAAITGTNASSALASIDTAIATISSQRSSLGAYQNRLESAVNSLGVATENLASSESRIRDTDMAQEMVNFTRNQILIQAGTSMLAQANSAQQSVLQLLKG